MLEVTSLLKCSEQLEKSLRYCKSDLAEQDPELFIQFRQSAIQAFEYTYELSIKMIKRKLKEIETPVVIDGLSFRDLIRVAAEKSLIDAPEAWFQYRLYRNTTSHTYDLNKAEVIYVHLDDFLLKVKNLIQNLSK